MGQWTPVVVALLLGPTGGNAERRRDRKHAPPVMVALTNVDKKPGRHAAGLRTLEFCVGCPDPRLEGSMLLGLAPKHGPRDYAVSGPLVYAMPNHGKPSAGAVLLNHAMAVGSVVLCDRGLVALVDKVKVAQASGAVGVVIVDDGSCDASEGQHNCGLAGSPRAGGFGYTDPSYEWRAVRIPSLFISAAEGERLRSMLNLSNRTVPGYGLQYVQT